MVEIKEINYVRKVTHTEYTFMRDAAKKVGILNKVDKVITDNKWKTTKEEVKQRKNFRIVNDEFIQLLTGSKVIPIIGGSVFAFLLLFFLIILSTSSEDFTRIKLIILILLSVGFLFFFMYYFTMPKKEIIYNRRDGLVTFPGFMWHKSITMSIHDVVFAYSQPSAQGIGAFQLRIVRPDKMFSQALMSFGGTCYEDLSFFLWYMDKNRPLPPGDAFDEFREQDFKRRKLEGFLEPMFPARFNTPEATAEQQAERERIGGW